MSRLKLEPIRENFERHRQRFLMNTVTDEPTSPITVILNWKAKR
jgi:hypothetical protein